MLTVVIGFLAFVVIYAAAGDGEWGAAGLAVVIVMLLRACSKQERRDWRAYRNFRDYWADGGPERKK